MVEEYAAVVLVIGAICAFLISTAQFSHWLRILFLAAGAGCLAAASMLIATSDIHFGLLRMLGDLWEHRGDAHNSVLARALARNGAQIHLNVLPLLDLFLVLAGTVGVLSAAALTPGMALERIGRTLKVALLGAVAGAALALSVAAIGLGGRAEPRSYFGQVKENDVIDGDTFWISGVAIRLAGIDAPELRQYCEPPRAEAPCGQEARKALARLLTAKKPIVECVVLGAGKRTRGLYGRPLAKCGLVGSHPDIGRRMIELGYAGPYRGKDGAPYQRVEPAQDAARLCWMDPALWRKSGARAGAEAFSGFGCS